MAGLGRTVEYLFYDWQSKNTIFDCLLEEVPSGTKILQDGVRKSL